MPDVVDSLQIDETTGSEVSELEPVEIASHPETNGIDPEETAGRLNWCPHPWKQPISCSKWLMKAAFGLASLVLFLAIVAAIPIVNLYTLGYLLDVQGRLARTGKFVRALPLLDLAPRFGSIVLGVTIFIFPVSLLASAASDAALIQAGSPQAVRLRVMTNLAAFAVTIHLILALARGGGLSCFFRPIKNARWFYFQLKNHQYIDSAARHLTKFVRDMQIKHYFSLGFRGFLGAAIWLIPPTIIYVSAEEPKGGQAVVTVLGGIILAVILCWLPVLQTRFAAENRFKAFFEVGEARRIQKRAPMLWFVAYLIAFAMSLPLYLFKVVSPPQDAMFFVTLVFLVTIYPTKLLLGWVYYWSNKRQQPSFFWRLPWKLTSLMTVGLYVFILFFTQFIGEQGTRVLYQNHTFLLPSPF